MALRFLPETGDHRAMDGWFTPGRLALILLAFAIPTFAGILVGTQTFVYRDFGFVTYPFAKVVRDSWLGGEAPLWNPASLCGIPFLAQWNTQALYPPALLYILLPMPWSLNLFCVGHLLAGGLGMYFLARRWTGNPFAAALAGTAFAYSGLAMSFLTWVHTASGFGLMPWVVLMVERGFREGGRMVVAGAAVGALQMLTGAPEIVFQTWVLLALMAAGHTWSVRSNVQDGRAEKDGTPHPCPLPGGEGELSTVLVGKAGEPTPAESPKAVTTELPPGQKDGIGKGGTSSPPPSPGLRRTGLPSLPFHGGEGEARSRGNRQSARIAFRFIAMVGLVTGLTAAQMLPFFDLLAHSQRGSGYGGSEWSVPVSGAANLMLPLFHTYRWPGGVFYQTGQFWIASYYFGAGVLALSVLTIVTISRTDPSVRRVWLLTAVAVFSFVMAFGDAGGLFKLIRTMFPQIGFMRFPVKFVALTVFIAPILAAFAVARLSEENNHNATRRRLVLIGLIVVSAIAVLRWLGLDPRIQPDLPEVGTINALVRAGLAILFLILISAWITAKGWTRFGIQLALLAVIWADLFTHAPKINPTVDSSVFDAGVVSLNPRPEFGRARVMSLPKANDAFLARMLANPMDDFYAKRAGLFANCNLLEGYAKVDGFYSLAPREFQQTHATIFSRTNDYSAPLADFLGVEYINSNTNFLKWDVRTNYMFLVSAGQKPVFKERDDILNSMQMPEFDPRQVVYLPPGLKPATTVTEGSAGARVLSGKFTAHRIDLEVTATAAALVVISQTYYHWWRAYEGEREIPIWRANNSFQALEVPAGRHHLKLVYRDDSFRIGSAVSALTILACAILWRRERPAG